jgi:hypothetical protein
MANGQRFRQIGRTGQLLSRLQGKCLLSSITVRSGRKRRNHSGGEGRQSTHSRPSAERRHGPLRRAKRTLGRSGRQHLVESNWSSVSIDERAICYLKVTYSAQPIEVRNAACTLSSLLPRSSGAIGYLLSALANR